jgi:hypothetical protein
LVNTSEEKRADAFVPFGLQIGAAWAWRLLVVAGLLYVLMRVSAAWSVVLIPVAVALLLAALLVPAVRWLESHGVPRGLASALVTAGGLAGVVGVLTFVVQQVIRGLPDLQANVTDSFNEVRDWLVTGPAHLSAEQIDNAIKAATDALTKNRESLTSGALTTATSVGHFVTSGLLTLFTLIFFLYDGPRSGHSCCASFRRKCVTGLTSPATVDSPRWLVTFAPRSWSPSLTPSESGSGSRSWMCRWRCRWRRWCSSVRSSRSSVRCCPASSQSRSRAAGVVVAGIIGALLAVPLVAVANAMVRSLHSDRPELVAAEVAAINPEDAAPPDEGTPLDPA